MLVAFQTRVILSALTSLFILKASATILFILKQQNSAPELLCECSSLARKQLPTIRLHLTSHLSPGAEFPLCITLSSFILVNSITKDAAPVLTASASAHSVAPLTSALQIPITTRLN